MKQIYVDLNSLHFYKDNGFLILSDWFLKTLFPLGSTDGIRHGGINVYERQFNQVQITFQDDLRLQCMVVHRNDSANCHFGSKEYIKEQLETLTGCPVMFKRNFSIMSKIFDNYIPLRDDMTYRDQYLPFNHLRNLKGSGKRMSFAFQNGPPPDLNRDIESLFLTDSYFVDLEFLQDLPKLKYLVIERCVILDPAGLGTLNQLTHLYLETLDLPGSSLFSDMAALMSVGIVDCGLVEVAGLSEKLNLTHCDISGNSIKDLSPLAGSTYLQWLTCEDTLIEQLDVCTWKQLKIMEIKGSWIEDIQHLDKCPDLKILDYSYTELGEESLIEIEYLVQTNGLLAFNQCADLDFFECPISVDHLDLLSK